MLYFQERLITRILCRSFSIRAVVYSTGWLGVPIHEISHLLAALLFGHKICKISFFDPDPETGTLGYVLHTYDPDNIYHLVGNFFIGIAPILGGSLVIFIAYYFLIHDISIINLGSSCYFNFLNLSLLAGCKMIGLMVVLIFKNIFHLNNFKSWQIWLFLYIIFCVGAHMAPSLPDLRHAIYGFLTIITGLLILNFAFSFLGGIPLIAIATGQQILSPIAAMLILAVLMNFLNILISILLSLTLGRVRWLHKWCILIFGHLF